MLNPSLFVLFLMRDFWEDFFLAWGDSLPSLNQPEKQNLKSPPWFGTVFSAPQGWGPGRWWDVCTKGFAGSHNNYCFNCSPKDSQLPEVSGRCYPELLFCYRWGVLVLLVGRGGWGSDLLHLCRLCELGKGMTVGWQETVLFCFGFKLVWNRNLRLSLVFCGKNPSLFSFWVPSTAGICSWASIKKI